MEFEDSCGYFFRLDIYLGFIEPVDHFLGRILAGLDAISSTFAGIPPHFVEGMDNISVKQCIFAFPLF